MTIKEIHTRAGSISGHGWTLFLVFCWYFAYNRFDSLGPGLLEDPMLSLIDWGLTILVSPFMLAGVFGGIHEQQRAQEEWSFGLFLKTAITHYRRILGANLLAIVLVLAGTFLMLVVLLFTGIAEPDPSENNLLFGIIGIPLAAILLFWFTAIVVERNVFGGLVRSLRTLLLNPFALALGLVWGLIGFADTAVPNYLPGTLNEEYSLALDGLRAAVLAVARVLATLYALSIYKQGRAEVQEAPAQAQSPTPSAEGWIWAGFGFGLLSFVPVLHLVALVVGIVALQRAKRFVMRAAVAVCAGGFFTVFYLLLVTGWWVIGLPASTAPGYAFLATENPALETYITLLDRGSYQEVQQKLGQDPFDSPARHWTFDFTLAMAKLQGYDLAGALEDFRTAAGKEPERGEFYYYYGLALLDNGQPTLAASQFQMALEHEPKIADARRYLDLIESTYEPSKLMSALLFIVILLILFTVHEYGHALAAWKLGDDTAEKQGRLTLNPIPHLELFGSILLPGLLLWQGAGIIFGWAKPVPVNPENFKDPRRDHMRVSFAGPAMNFLIAMACFILLGGLLLALRLFWPGTLTLNLSAPFSPVSLTGPPFARWLILLVLFLKGLFYTSLVLGVFNLIPIPPLDGSWILSGLLPPGPRALFEKIRPYAFVLFLLLVMTSVMDYFMMIPISLTWGALELVVSAMGFG